jgi:hypothetical protein
VVHEDHHPKKKLIDGIFRKLMVYTGQFQTWNVNFVKNAFTSK